MASDKTPETLAAVTELLFAAEERIKELEAEAIRLDETRHEADKRIAKLESALDLHRVYTKSLVKRARAAERLVAEYRMNT